MDDTKYIPKRMYLKMTPQAAQALSAIAQSQSGTMTDPRKVAWSMIEEMLLARGLIANMSLPIVKWSREQE